ncbi:small ribosomal subunit protein bS18m [Musca vetustissima]|uniref:small ribosomal subunit protein bS18m n=1 Tax=Musca vetustissima TaxID=27455 RepID=UPI002AB658BB|nr:small ribosomal subunit protein bS18m [Musca vetustissima]
MFKLTKVIAQNASAFSGLAKNLRPLSTAAIRYSASAVTGSSSSSNAVATNPDEPVQIANPFEKERKVCILCKHNITPDYKNVKLLSQFQSPYTGRIYGRHITGLCKQKQEEVEKAIRRAQHCALMPTYHKDLEFLKDPKLFDPEKPIRPHKY